MKNYDFGLTLTILIFVTCVIAGTLSITFLGPDNPVEETAEAVIKEETGIKLDLSPSSPEHSQAIVS